MRRYDEWRAKTERDTKTMYLTYVPKMVHTFNIISIERRYLFSSGYDEKSNDLYD